jgi:hypothetical protein
MPLPLALFPPPSITPGTASMPRSALRTARLPVSFVERLPMLALRSPDPSNARWMPSLRARTTTYLHLPIVAGIIAAAVGANLIIAEPGDPQHGVGLAMILGGPAL